MLLKFTNLIRNITVSFFINFYLRNQECKELPSEYLKENNEQVMKPQLQMNKESQNHNEYISAYNKKYICQSSQMIGVISADLLVISDI